MGILQQLSARTLPLGACQAGFSRRPSTTHRQASRNIRRQKWLMRCRTNKATTPTQHFQKLGSLVLILDNQCGKQIVNVDHFSASCSRFKTRKENNLPSTL